MKMTFEIPDEVAERFKTSVPSGSRSYFLTSLLQSGLSGAENDLEAACDKANALKLDLSEWEKLNESEAW
ncbi:MAG: hypothetical protein KIS67_20225 [Verrucomicrobiae bacterium]|nr:hypothetical protein [Verrucomicrobiae bacterium]